MGSKIKVMQIIPSLAIGGAEIMVEHLSVALAGLGIDSRVVSLYDYHSPITEKLEDQDIPIYYLKKKKGFDIKLIFRLYKLFKKEKPEVIHTHLYAMPYAVIAAILSGVPIRVHTIHSIANKEVGIIKRKINHFFYKYFRVMPVAISPLVKKTVIEEYLFSENKVPMIYNGIDLNKVIRKKEYQTKNEIINLLHIGSFKEAKNHLQLIESFQIVNKKVPNTILTLIGEGDLEKNVKDSVRELNLENNVQFLGLKSNVYPYLNEADIFVLPSIWEGMPITLIEAMATGLPIVATGVGGVPDMIKDKFNGLLVDLDENKIAGAILNFIKDSNLREKMGDAARVTSQDFSALEMAERYIRLYNKS